MRPFFAGLVAGALILCAGYALASRNSSGTMSAVNGPYVPGTTISSSQINARFADIEREITDSLSRSGKGGMTAFLKEADGTVSSPAFTFNNEPVSGLYRIGANDLGLTVNGALKHEWTGTGETTTGTSHVTGAQTVDGAGTFGGSLGIGGLFTQTISGTASNFAAAFLQPSLLNTGSLALQVGNANSTQNAALFAWFPNATAALGAACMGVTGVSGTSLCVNGNQKTTAAGDLAVAGAAAITGATTLTGALTANGGTTTTTLTTSSTVKHGAAGSTFVQMSFGSCTLTTDGTLPSACTATVASGATCFATVDSVGSTAFALAVHVSGTTLTVGNSDPAFGGAVVNWLCFG